jgi:hypothetical protein
LEGLIVACSFPYYEVRKMTSIGEVSDKLIGLPHSHKCGPASYRLQLLPSGDGLIRHELVTT